LVDGTAGRLVRWLRILGLDAEYVPACDQAWIARLARQTGRRVVTRSRSLADRLEPDAILLASDDVELQLSQVVAAIGADKCEVFSRCSLCNARIAEVAKESVRGRVPAYVFANQEKFSVCTVCGRYYWQGTHWQHMLDRVNTILKERRHE
jgi:uncharacterized protein with PIN domain